MFERDRVTGGAVVLVLALGLLGGGCATARAPIEEAQRIAEVLQLQPGMQVADVGAGDGEWAEDLAGRVGKDGHVFATEVDEDDLDEIRERFEEDGLSNVTAILGNALDTGLPATCCDAILLRQVYHHFTDPEPMRASLRQSLREGGRIAVIEIKPQGSWSDLPGVPDRGGHGISPDDLVEEMTGDGFHVVSRHDDWDDDDDDRYCVVFEVDESP